MNKKKGFTLVEVLVSITIFLTVFSVVLSTYYLAQKRVYKQEETQYIENLCLDIDKIYDNEGYEGLVNYYKFKALEDSDITSDEETKDEIPTGYYKSSSDDSSSTDNEPTSDESSENNTGEEAASNDDSSSSDGDSSTSDKTEEVNQVKKVVEYLITYEPEENNEYLGTIDKTLNSTTTSEKDSATATKDGDPKTDFKFNLDNTKMYNVSIQKYSLEYKESVHTEIIDKIEYQKYTFSKEGSIYFDSNYKKVDSEDSCKYLLTYSFKSSLYKVNTTYVISDYTNNVKETFNEYTTTKSYTKNSEDSGANSQETGGDTSSGDSEDNGTDSSELGDSKTTTEETGNDNTGSSESENSETDSSDSIDSYTEDTETVEYEPTKEDIDLTIETVQDESTVKKTRMIKTEYIKKLKSDTSLTITITNIKDNYVLIKDLEYGSSKYDDTYLNEFKQEMEDSKGEYDGI